MLCAKNSAIVIDFPVNGTRTGMNGTQVCVRSGYGTLIAVLPPGHAAHGIDDVDDP